METTSDKVFMVKSSKENIYQVEDNEGDPIFKKAATFGKGQLENA